MAASTVALTAAACSGEVAYDGEETRTSALFGGYWETPVTYPTQVVHALLVPPNWNWNSKIVVTGGSQYNCCSEWGYNSAAYYNLDGTWTALGSLNPYYYADWYCGGLHNPDAFCSGHTVEPFSGYAFFAGGLQDVTCANTQGLVNSAYINPGTNSSTQLGSMPAPRYYPTVVNGTDGTQYVFQGNDYFGNNRIFKRSGASWIDTAKDPNAMATYPRVHMLPNGKFFIVTPRSGDRVNQYYDPVANTLTPAGTAQVPMQANDDIYGSFDFASVLLPLKASNGVYTSARIMITNGTKYWVRDALNPNSTWVDAGRPSGFTPKRRYANATILSTGQVLIDGGSQSNSDADAVPFPEIWGTSFAGLVLDGWDIGYAAQVKRNYHSVSLLLPDGRVWTNGSNKNAAGSRCGGNLQCDMGAPDNRERRVEIYRPWYVDVPRPVISSCPDYVSGYGQNVVIGVGNNDGLNIQTVALIAPGSATHAFNNNQRFVYLDVVSRTSSSVTVKSPYTAGAAPIGPYMLVILRKHGTGTYSPSKASVACWTWRIY